MNKKTAMVVVNPADYGLDETKARQVEAAFQPMIDKMVELEAEFNRISALPIAPETCREAKRLRLEYVKVRTGTAVIHKKAKALHLARGRFVDGWKNAQLYASTGVEDKLRAIEDHYINIERVRVEKLQAERQAILEPYETGYIPPNLGEMDEAVWNNYIAGVKLSYNQQKEAEQKAADEQAAREKEEAEERERIRKENEKLKKDAEKREKVIAATAAKRKKEDDLRLEREREEDEKRERAKEKTEAVARRFKEKLLKERLAREKEEERTKELERELKASSAGGGLIKELKALVIGWRKGPVEEQVCADQLEEIINRYDK